MWFYLALHKLPSAASLLRSNESRWLKNFIHLHSGAEQRQAFGDEEVTSVIHKPLNLVVHSIGEDRSDCEHDHEVRHRVEHQHLLCLRQERQKLRVTVIKHFIC